MTTANDQISEISASKMSELTRAPSPTSAPHTVPYNPHRIKRLEKWTAKNAAWVAPGTHLTCTRYLSTAHTVTTLALLQRRRAYNHVRVHKLHARHVLPHYGLTVGELALFAGLATRHHRQTMHAIDRHTRREFDPPTCTHASAAPVILPHLPWSPVHSIVSVMACKSPSIDTHALSEASADTNNSDIDTDSDLNADATESTDSTHEVD